MPVFKKLTEEELQDREGKAQVACPKFQVSNFCLRHSVELRFS